MKIHVCTMNGRRDSYLVGEVQRKQVRLLPSGDLDGERDPDGEPERHGGAEGAVMGHLALHPVLAHRAESSASDER